MNFQSCVTLGLLAAVLVAPQTVLSQDTESGETTDLNVCSDQPGGLVGSLGQLGNLLGNLLFNFGPLKALALANPIGLLDLQATLLQVQILLVNLLKGLLLGNLNSTGQNGPVGDLVNQLTNLLNNLLGRGRGDEMRCATPTGSTGGPTESLFFLPGGLIGGFGASNPLISLVDGLLRLVGGVLRAVGGLVGGLLPGL